MALEATVKASISGTLTSTPDLASVAAKIAAALSVSFTDGAGAGQANVVFNDTRTITASSNEDLDLSGSLTNSIGGSAVFARIKAILVKAASGNTNNVNVTRPASNGVPLFLAASDGIAIKPGGAFLWVAPDASGVAVTADTGDLINLANSAGSTSVTYDIVIVGAAT